MASDVWAKLEALRTSALQGKLCEMQFLFVKMRGDSVAWPLAKEWILLEETISETSAKPLHTPLTNVKKR